MAGSSTHDVTLCDVSVIGAQIDHSEPLRPAMRGRLCVSVLSAEAVVIWTRMAVPGRYRSGLRLEEAREVVAAAIRDMLQGGLIRKVEDTARQREQARVRREETRARLVPWQAALPAEAIQTIRSARNWLLRYPDEAIKWCKRARMTATDDLLRVAGSGRLNRDDVLAVWEYLGRRFAVGEIVRALDQPKRGE